MRGEPQGADLLDDFFDPGGMDTPVLDQPLERAPRDLDLFHPWLIGAEEAVQIAQRCEAAAFAVDKRVTNSEGASVYAQQSQFVMANSAGFIGGYPYTRHSVSVSPIAGKGNNMQRDDWYSAARAHGNVADPEALGRYAGERSYGEAANLSTRAMKPSLDAMGPGTDREVPLGAEARAKQDAAHGMLHQLTSLSSGSRAA